MKSSKNIYSSLPLLFSFTILFTVASFATQNNSIKQLIEPTTADPNATAETKALFKKLYLLMDKHTLFGHEDDLEYGYGWRFKRNNPYNLTSDIYNTCGKYPAIFGWDLGGIERTIENKNINYLINGILVSDLRKHIMDVDQMGGINTFMWHCDDPATKASAFEQPDGSTVCKILEPGSKAHQVFNQYLDKLGDFFKSLRSANGKLIPVIFRPFHEASMKNYFWWNYFSGSCSHDNYASLWQYTFEYLTKTKGVHNLLFCFTVNHDFLDNQKKGVYDIMEDYVGENFFDIIGDDIYHSPREKEPLSRHINEAKAECEYICWLAKKFHKIPAITETGEGNFTDKNYWTNVFVPIFSNSKLAYVMLWRNPDRITDFTDYYCVFPTHPSAENFRKFVSARNRFLFLEDLKALSAPH
ncbi:MAG: hypothetical protein KGO81_11620 [Bacteroidota bacterium]|nr:hypothetical protein [Bacteroidota bacterium]